MTLNPGYAAAFTIRLIVAAPAIWVLWWTFAPFYAWCVGQLGGQVISLLNSSNIQALRIDAGGSILECAKIVLVLTQQHQEFPFMISSLITNTPPFLVVLTP